MSAEHLFNHMEFLFSVAILILFFATVWQQLCIDITRQNYFELRDQLFRLAIEGKLNFDDPMYRQIRHLLNIRIRMAHRITISSFLAYLIARKGVIPETHTPFDDIESLEDEDLRSELRDIYKQANQFLVAHIISRSPLYLLFAPLILLLIFFLGGVRVCMHWLSSLSRIVDDDTTIRRVMLIS